MVSNSSAGNSFARNSTVTTTAPSEQRLPASELCLKFLLISSNLSLGVTQKLIIYALKMKVRSSLKKFDEARDRG